MVFAIGRRSNANINGNIQNAASLNAHQFTLGLWWSLKMQSAYYASIRKAFVVLHKICFYALIFEMVVVIAFKEIPSVITKDGGFYFKKILYGGWYEFHVFKNTRISLGK